MTGAASERVRGLTGGAGPAGWTGSVLLPIPVDESVLLFTRAHPLYIPLRVLGRLVIIACVGGLAMWLATFRWMPFTARGAGLATATVGAAVLIWSFLDWLLRVYAMTDRRVMWVSGVLRRLTVDAPLESVQHMVLYRSIRERPFRLGTIGFATAGTGTVEVVWSMVAHPQHLMDEARGAILRAAKGRRADRLKHGAAEENGVTVIGLAGGIGAGKSEVASIFGRLGCVVIDSDREARAALDRPQVRVRLVSWWGQRVLRSDGRVDRRAVAAIVFAEPEERRRLEELVHPLVRVARRQLIERARQAGAPAVVVDAPLLFEAGVDRECDHIVFVDAPRDKRLERLSESRQWDEAELERREASQWPLEQKRAGSDSIVMNDGSIADLESQVRGILDRLLRPGQAGASDRRKNR